MPARKYTSIKKWWMKLFGVRFTDNVPGGVRETCERYGEQVIKTMLAGGFTPSTSDLQALYTSDETRLQTRDWLTERTDIQEYRERYHCETSF